MDAMLISANPSLVEMDDALAHLEDHEQLYWDVPVPIRKANFEFPIWAFIHISREGVQYRATVVDILPFAKPRTLDPTGEAVELARAQERQTAQCPDHLGDD